MTDKTDREMLELAARAAGYSFKWGKDWHDKGAPLVDDKLWNPLTDDGDAFRLMVKCGIVVEYRREVPACFAYHYALNLEVVQRNDQLDPLAATRRAIVKAAAEIGKGMK